MATSPMASVIEASSDAYPQCTEYRRRVILLKINEHDSVAIDIFTVKGGSEHRYRVFSDLATSDTPDGTLTFTGIDMPEEAPLPNTGNSLKPEDIFGLRDVRTATPTGNTVQATWSQPDKQYRLTLFTDQSMTIEASNGPGQRSLEEAGRRVRYVDAVRKGEDLRSTFIAVHESSSGSDEIEIRKIFKPLVGHDGGPNSEVFVIEGANGFNYLIMNNIDRAVRWGRVYFKGDFLCMKLKGIQTVEYMTLGAQALKRDFTPLSVEGDHWSGSITRIDEYTFEVDTPAPDLFTPPTDDIQAYVRIKTPDGWTGFPLKSIDGQRITVDRFPLPESIEAMELPSVTYGKF